MMEFYYRGWLFDARGAVQAPFKLQLDFRFSGNLPSPTPVISSMDGKTYPGEGLSLSQLVFALNQKLKPTARSPSYVSKDHHERYTDSLS